MQVVCGESAGGYDGTVTIYNCYTEGNIGGISAGGICGKSTGTGDNTTVGGTVKIYNCYTTGDISGQERQVVYVENLQEGYDGTVTIYNCYTTGTLSGAYSGGICGNQAGYNDGTMTIYNCYTTGTISGSYSGGICGNYAGFDGNVYIYNCYTTGNISGKTCRWYLWKLCKDLMMEL